MWLPSSSRECPIPTCPSKRQWLQWLRCQEQTHRLLLLRSCAKGRARRKSRPSKRAEKRGEATFRWINVSEGSLSFVRAKGSCSDRNASSVQDKLFIPESASVKRRHIQLRWAYDASNCMNRRRDARKKQHSLVNNMVWPSLISASVTAISMLKPAYQIICLKLMDWSRRWSRFSPWDLGNEHLERPHDRFRCLVCKGPVQRVGGGASA